MFHLEFQQNQQNSENSVPGTENVSKVRPSKHKEEVQGKYNTDCLTLSENESTNDLYNTCGEDTADELLVKKREDSISYDPFIYESNQKLLVFLCMSDDYIMKCPMCLIETKQIIQHITKSNKCKISGNLNSFKEQFRLYKEQYMKEEERKRKKAYGMKKRLEDSAKVKDQQRKCKEINMIKKRAEDNEEVKEQQRKRKEINRMKKRAEDDKEVKELQRKCKEINRIKKKSRG